MPLLNIGDTVPDVTFQFPDRSMVPLSSYKGKKNVVIAFYPRAFTGG